LVLDCGLASKRVFSKAPIILHGARAHLIVRKRPIPAAAQTTELSMRVSSTLRISTLVVALAAVLGTTGGAFAASSQDQNQNQNQSAQQQAVTNNNPYDSQDFTIPDSNIYP
jgi:uncharacterized protein HemX